MLAAIAIVAKARGRTGIVCFAATLVAASFREFFAIAAALLAIAAARGDNRATRVRAGLSAGVAAVVVMLTLRAVVHVQAFDAGASPLAFIDATAGVALRLAKDLVLPTDLAVYVSVPSLGALSFVVLAVFAAGAFALHRATKDDARIVAWLGIAIAAATAAMHGVVAVKYGAISDRYAYEFAVAAAFVGAAVFESTRARIDAALAKSRLAPLARATPIVFAIALAPLSWARAAQYRDEATLQASMMEERPDDPESRLAESFRLFAKGDLEAAYPHCAAYAAARPKSDRANLCVGTWLLAHGRAAEAVPLLRPYALARPGDPRARRALFASLFASGDLAGVATQLAAWEPMFPDAPDVVEAREELERRRAQRK